MIIRFSGDFFLYMYSACCPLLYLVYMYISGIPYSKSDEAVNYGVLYLQSHRSASVFFFSI